MTWQRCFRRLRSVFTFVALIASVVMVVLIWHPLVIDPAGVIYGSPIGSIDENNSRKTSLSNRKKPGEDFLLDDDSDLLRFSDTNDDQDDVEEQENRLPRLPGESRRLPGCIIIGARKCGTRALLEFLNLHPDIRTADHELHFFDRDHIYARGVDWYRRRMPYTLTHQVTIEKTPAYFVNPHAPERVHRLNESIRLLLIVREPVRRTVSDYTQVHMTKLSKGKSHEPFELSVVDQRTGRVRSCYKPVRNSLYYNHLRRWLEYFPLERIHLVDGDRFVDDPLSELRKVESFLGLSHKIDASQLYYNRTKGFYCYRHPSDGGSKCLGETKGRTHVNVTREVREKLEQFFAPFNRLFFDLTNRTFDWRTTMNVEERV